METKENKTIIAYKGFDENLQCRGFQYEVGKEYEINGGIKVCERGFHACKSPLEVLEHYFFNEKGQMARFCVVEQSGDFSQEENSTKVASSKIKIKAELKFADLIKLGVEWLKEKTSTGKGIDAKLSDKGGNYAKIGSSGYSAKIGSSGGYAQIGSSGNSAQIGSSGYYAKIGSSGDNAQIGSSGDCAKIGSSGYSAKINSTGEDSVICCAGTNSMAKAKKGSWITLSEWVYNGKKNPICTQMC